MEKKLYLFNALARINRNNVNEIYNIEFNRWRYMNSSKVIVDGEEVSDKFEKQLLLRPNQQGDPNIN
ncbi:MAG TPA: hypothetical protein ENN24_03660, partial [Bacteroidetes bacterium]|nr:hypothetical protein [Bacteroidota bacterium]